MAATPNHALQRMAPVCHACCFRQNPPRSSHASPPPSLSLIVRPMRALNPPPAAANDPNATELLRLWAANNKLDVVINIGLYEEQGHDEAKAWGIIISDFTRHVSRALAQRYGSNEEQEMAKIRDAFLREIETPTSDVTGE